MGVQPRYRSWESWEELPAARAWWPLTWIPPQVQFVDRRPTSDVLMIRPLRDRTLPLPPLSAEDVLYWHADAF